MNKPQPNIWKITILTKGFNNTTGYYNFKKSVCIIANSFVELTPLLLNYTGAGHTIIGVKYIGTLAQTDQDLYKLTPIKQKK